MSGPLIIGVPSKGRLQENANAFFARAGMNIRQHGGARSYAGSIARVDDVEIAFLSASEISRNVAEGAIHLGVTGADLLHESIPDLDAVVQFVTPLGFGYADVVVAVPQSWIDVSTMADLDDVAAAFYARRRQRMRVATKYVNLTRAFFARHGISDYRIVESLGATEGTPGAGSAELIVDITTTGATLAANALKILDDGVILQSEANLVASLKAQWSAKARAALNEVLSRVAGEERARTMREVRFSVPGDPAKLIGRAIAEFECATPAPDMAGGACVLHCPGNKVYALSNWLMGQGAQTVTVAQLSYIFQARNGLYDKVAARLGW